MLLILYYIIVNLSLEENMNLQENSRIESVHKNIVASSKAGTAKPYEFRIQQLKQIKRFYLENQNEIMKAVYQDLHRPGFEAIECEVLPAVMEIDFIFLILLRGWHLKILL